MNRPVRNLVVIAPNWLGDAVMSLPAIADVQRALSEGSITVAARPAVAPLFGMVTGLNGVIPMEGGFSSLIGKGFDTALLFPNSFHSALLASRAGIPERWGYRTDWRRLLLTRAIGPPSELHQVDYYQQLVRALGFPGASRQPQIVVTSDQRDAGARGLRAAGWDGSTPLVALAPGAAYGGAKRWPATSFAELARALAGDGVQSVMVGSRADEPVGAAIRTAFGASRGLLDLMGTDLPTLVGVLASCRALVSNDSGAMHLGAAIGLPVTAVFGPTDERATRPIGDAHTVLVHPVWCRPCMLRECPLDHRCMQGVAVETVASAARRML
jgi:heptosyltransferase-2